MVPCLRSESNKTRRMDSLLFVVACLLFVLQNKSFAFVPSSRTRTSKARAVVAFSIMDTLQETVVSTIPAESLVVQDFSGPLLSLKETILSADPDVEAEFLMDISHILMDFTAFLNFDGSFLNYAQLAGRITFIAIDFLPGHAFHVEEMAVQLFLLGLNLKKIQSMTADEEDTFAGNDLAIIEEEDHQETSARTSTILETAEEEVPVDF